MPANDIQINDLIAEIALQEFRAHSTMLMTSNRSYTSDFQNAQYRTGDAVRIRQPNRANVRIGRVADPSPYNEEVEYLTLGDLIGVDREYDVRELTLFLDTRKGPFMDNVIRPAIQSIKKHIESNIAKEAIKQLTFTSGDPSANINSYQIIDLAKAKMRTHGIPLDMENYLHLNPTNASYLRGGAVNYFNKTLNDDIWFKSSLGEIADFYAFDNESIATHNAGNPVGTPVLAAEVSSGNIFTVSGLTPSAVNVFSEGDTITIAGVNSVNPIDKSNSGYLKEFTVSGGTEIDPITGNRYYNASGGGEVTITVINPVKSDVADEYRNVTIALPAGAAVATKGAGTSFKSCIMTPYNGLSVVNMPIAPLDNAIQSVAKDDDSNLSITITRDSDSKNFLNTIRFDVLIGIKWHELYALKLLGAL